MPDTATSLDSHAGLMFHSADFISSEAKLRDEENRKAISDPDYLEKAKEENRQRYNNKVSRKGFK